MPCSSSLVSPGSRAALAAVGIAVDGRYSGEHGRRSRDCPTFLDEAKALTPGLSHYPASIGLIQARAIHASFEGDLDTAKAASSAGAAQPAGK
jgi:hypothetical protein